MSPRFRLRDLVLATGIAALLLALLILSARRTHEDIKRVKCQDNLRVLGQAIQNYQRSVGYFPTEVANKQNGSSGSVYYDINTFIQVSDREGMAVSREAQAVREFRCPARYGREVGPKTDYGYGANSEFGDSVLASVRPVTLSVVEQADGSAYTLMLSHKGVRPSQYDGSGPNDLDWFDIKAPNSRDPLALHRDADNLDMWKLIGSPHGDGAPSLIVDGHVEVLPYVGSNVRVNGVPLMAARWAYNDGNR